MGPADTLAEIFLHASSAAMRKSGDKAVAMGGGKRSNIASRKVYLHPLLSMLSSITSLERVLAGLEGTTLCAGGGSLRGSRKQSPSMQSRLFPHVFARLKPCLREIRVFYWSRTIKQTS